MEEPEPAQLTDREKSVMRYLAEGLRVKEISEKLNIRDVTTNMHIANAKKKLSAATREEAVAKAIFSGLISP